MNRLLALLAATIALAAIAAFAAVLGARAGERSRTFTLNAGDIVRVAGNANVGCRVKPHDGVETLDCRRAGPLTGTYGTLFNRNEVLVVRFESAKLAKIVFSAKHRNRKVTRCG
jgi:hypothetical protein